MIGFATRPALPPTALGAALALMQVTMASAAPTKVWVSNAGADNASCGAISSPCATFQQAHNNVAAGGEIGVLTPGDYVGGNIINKSINLSNDGVGEATAIAGGTIGIAVEAGAGDVVSLRGLTLDGQGSSGTVGIFLQTGSALHVQNCVIRNYEASRPGEGVGIAVQAIGNGKLFVSDTIIFNNGSDARSGGVVISPPGGANVVLDRVHLENNVIGLLADGSFGTGNGVHLVIRDSVVSGNASDGIRAFSAAGTGPAFLVVERTTSVDNAGAGILADGPHATILLDGSLVSRNGVGIGAAGGGQLISYGNNKVNNNLGADGVPTGSYSRI